MIEVWKPVVGFVGLYEVSNRGRVRSLIKSKRFGTGHILKPTGPRNASYRHGNYRYQAVGLTMRKKSKMYFVHRLVLAAFVGPSLLSCNHINGVHDDNRLENLEYVTNAQNSQHASRLGLLACGSRNSMSKMDEHKVAEMRRVYAKGGISLKALGKLYKMSRSGTHHIIAGHVWRYV